MQVRSGLAHPHIWRSALAATHLIASAFPDPVIEGAVTRIDGIIVFNHGGRQLDCATSSLDALERIAAEGLSLTIMHDGGIRRGSDVPKAIRLGADFGFVGRSLLQAAAVGGENGVIHALDWLTREINLTMCLLGIIHSHAARGIELRRDSGSAE
jgi:L-lactate dehydrogenase (cytochrome)